MSLLALSKIRFARSWVKRAGRCENGMAATEFALILPFLAFLFFGMLEASEALTVNRRVSKAVNTLSDLTAQVDTISPSEFDNLVDGVTEILNPASLAGVEMTVVSVVPDTDGDPIVHWSRDRDGNEPYVAGTDYNELDNADVLDVAGSVIVAEIIYPHTLSISHQVLGSPINFEVKSIRWPRNAGTMRVQFCSSPGNCTS